MATEAAKLGNIKATRDDWLNAARDLLVQGGVSQVKILTLSQMLKVSRSSFYWYFEDRTDLQNALLDGWEQRNTQTIVDACDKSQSSITEGACNFFRCFIDPASFDQGLDFAIRGWSRHDDNVAARIHAADEARLTAIQRMFERHGYAPKDANARARILYYMQLGYHALDVAEPMDVRMDRVEAYLLGFTGQDADPRALQHFREFAMQYA